MLLHTDSTRFPNSIMSAGSYGSETGHLLTPTDREALLAVYSGLELQASPDQTVENLGPWDDISVHIRGSFDAPDGQVSFGVASRNGLAQPWAFGPTPSTDLADNPILSGTASWSGRLLGFTPTVEVIAGTADLAMDLGTLNGQLEFANLESWAPNAAPDRSVAARYGATAICSTRWASAETHLCRTEAMGVRSPVRSLDLRMRQWVVWLNEWT